MYTYNLVGSQSASIKQEDKEEEKKEDQSLLKELKLKSTGTLIQIKDETKAQYTITQTVKVNKQQNIKRKLICKTNGCKFGGEILCYGKSDEFCELKLNLYDHLPTCKDLVNPFNSKEMRVLTRVKLKPSEIISEFNKTQDNEAMKLVDNEENRRKISQLKYVEKVKDQEDKLPKIASIRDLKLWMEGKYISNLTDEAFTNLGWDLPFVANYRIDAAKSDFFAFVTTKNCLYNVVKQKIGNHSRLCADGTYKLVAEGYPTIIIGTTDINRKLHLGKKFSILYRKVLSIYF